MKAPCEACPPCCSLCAWNHAVAIPAPEQSSVVRTSEAYGCVKGGEIIIDLIKKVPLFRRDGRCFPLSEEYGDVIRHTKLGKDIMAVMPQSA